MNTLIAFSAKHPISVLSVLLAIVLLGFVCVFIIPVDFLPVISTRILLVAAEYPGISAPEMRTMIAIPLEDAFASLKGLKSTSSVIRDGLALISLELHWGTDVDIALVECREIIDVCFTSLPSGCSKPVAVKNDSSQRETITIALMPVDGDLIYSRYIADTDIKPRLQRLSGVGAISITGGEKEEIQVQLYKERLDPRLLSIQNIAEIIAVSNFEYPAGTIREGEKDLSIKTSGLFLQIDDIGNTPVSYNSGGLLRIKDIAETIRTTQEKESFFLLNGKESIKIGIQKKYDASPLMVSRLIKNELVVMTQLYGAWYDLKIIDDVSVQIYDSLKNLIISGLIGMLFAWLVIKRFLKSYVLSFLIASIIPISILISVFFLAVFEKTLNIMSLSGIAIGIGLVVDAATIVVENIQNRMLTQKENSFFDIVINGTSGVAKSNLGSTLTTVIVFLPVFFIKGLFGELFKDMAVAIIISIVASCILSFTYIPAMVMLFKNRLNINTNFEDKFLKRIEEKYAAMLQKIFRRRFLALIPLGVCVVTGILSWIPLRLKLLPELTSYITSAKISLPYNTTIASMQDTALQISDRLSRIPFVKSVQISGGIERDEYLALSNPGEIRENLRLTVHTTIPAKNAQNIIKDAFYQGNMSIIFEANQDILSQLLDLRDDITIVRGDSQESLANQLTAIPVDAEIVPNVSLKETIFTPDRSASARFSVSAQYIASIARNALEGMYTASFFEKGREIPIKVKYRKDDIGSLDDLKNTNVQLSDSYIPLWVLGSFTEQVNEKILYRYNRKDSKMIVGDKNSKIALFDTISPGKIELREMIANGIYLLLITLILLYLVMGAQFESFIIPLALLAALPPSFSGAFTFLAVFGKSLNINSIIALVILFGISVNNTILLYEAYISQTNLNKEAVIEASVRKFRAILITNGTTILSLLPFSIDPKNVSAQSSLVLAVMGGLLFSTVLVLLVIPILFSAILTKKTNE
ncbi:MAG: efflux RND transporter permease subunit [Treponema sp.]|jgi:multidrug efflux pump subunit AcrB|nr:efflux RND transporter permease subunit [Treponema sp.]